MKKKALQNENTILKITGLSISFPDGKNRNTVVQDINFDLNKGESLAIVGESGSGKSVTSFSIMGLLPPKISSIDTGSILFKSKELKGLSEKDWRPIRGDQIAMVFQEPMTSLNPVMRCGEQVAEGLIEHQKISKSEARKKVVELFEKVKLPRPEEIYSSYPHEISGGQKQRVVIAMALISNPEILIADEPTTALDVTVQKEIMELLKSLQKEMNLGLLFISHDLDVIKNIADHIIVMKEGKIVEYGKTHDIFNNPQNEYTKGLIHCKPPVEKRPHRLPTVEDFIENKVLIQNEIKSERVARHKELYSTQPILSVRGLSKIYSSSKGILKRHTTSVKAVDNVTFDIYPGETLGLVGESGCGKTTLSRCILNLIQSTSGKILYRGKEIQDLNDKEMRPLRKEIQIIFQDPYSSLNPKKSIGEAIQEPMEVHKLFSSKKERKEKVLELLEKTGLKKEHYDRYPHEFSGGQRQRIVIARTLALSPKLIVCDESVSALDVSVQAQVLNLLNDLKEEFGFTYLFISHDLSVVKYMSDRILVMNAGKIEEIQESDALFENPKSTYTRQLINSMY